VSEEKLPDSVHLRKVPKVHGREDVTKRRQTIAVSDDVAEAFAGHTAAGRGRIAIQRELSMKLASSASQQEGETELALAFSKLHRRASQTAQAHQTSANIEQNKEVDTRKSVQEPPKPSHCNPITSQKLISVSSLPVFSKSGPHWKSMTCLASDESAVQKTSSIKNSQMFQPGDNHLVSKRRSVALAASSSDCRSSTSTPVNSTCVKSHANSETSNSTEMEKCSTNNSMLRSSDKEETKPTHPTGALIASVVQPTEKHDAKNMCQPGDQHESNNPLTDLERADASGEHQSDSSSEKQTLTADEASTNSVVQKSISDVIPSSDVNPQQPSAKREFLRQKSCPGKTEHHVNNNTATQLVGRSLGASSDGLVNMPYAAQGLRSCAEWKTDDGGNKLEIKLRKSHSIALKPRNNSNLDDTFPANKPVLKRTTSTAESSAYHPPGHRDVRPATEVKVLMELSDKPSSRTSVCQSDEAQVADHLTAARIQRCQLLKAGHVIAEKKMPSVALTGSRCEGIPGEPIWIALARQKTQRWTEGKV